MTGKGNCYDNAAVEFFFKTIKAELIWRWSWETRRKAEMAISNTSMAFTIRGDVIQPWAGKVLPLSNERWLKRALGAAQKRDRSTPDRFHPRDPVFSAPGCEHLAEPTPPISHSVIADFDAAFMQQILDIAK